MSYYWFFIYILWVRAADTQYVETGGAGALESTGLNEYTDYYSSPTSDKDFVKQHNDAATSETFSYPIYSREIETSMDQQTDVKRKRRTPRVSTNEAMENRQLLHNLVDTDKSMYLGNGDNLIENPFLVQGYSEIIKENSSGIADKVNKMMVNKMIAKKSFSPWGGKRDFHESFDQLQSWKRATNVKEPGMPKRVRFSPWGGKRNNLLFMKPESKKSKIIFSKNVPDVTRIVSEYSSNGERYNLAGFRLIPSLDKRQPIGFLTFSPYGENHSRGMNPLSFLDALPKLYKPGQPFLDLNLKKDGKRKVKFSAWGGKRSPPVIGPIWTPSTRSLKEKSLDTVLLIRNTQN